jgi:DUF971 family protein
MMDNIRIKAIQQLDGRTLGILWTDDQAQKFDVVALRRSCPCATCIDEWTHERRLKPEDVADSVRPVRIESVGQYAMSVHFSDGHRTGIYTFPMLRKMASH